MAQPNHFLPPSRGFTLIELSIVLVIIGLLVGGVLVGRDLIQAAHLRQQVSQLERYSTAAQTFKAKYGALPGDIAQNKRPDFGLRNDNIAFQPCPVNDGGIYACGGLVASGVETGLIYIEPILFFYDLAFMNLIPDKINYSVYNALVTPGDTVPSLALHPEFGMVALTFQGRLGYYLGITPGFGNNWTWLDQHSSSGALSPLEASQLDGKLDDGIPSTGRVMAVMSTELGIPIYADTTTQCVADATAKAYANTDTPAMCRMFIAAW